MSLKGGIRSGSPRAAEMLARKGAKLVSADAVGHEVYEPGRPAYQEIVDAFGRNVLGPDGRIDRKRLGPIVFSDPEQLRRLNAITHPRMKELMREKLDAERARGAPIAVLEAALLFDAGWDDLTDEIWVTVARPEVAAARTAGGRGIPVEGALLRLRTQMRREEGI